MEFLASGFGFGVLGLGFEASGCEVPNSRTRVAPAEGVGGADSVERRSLSPCVPSRAAPTPRDARTSEITTLAVSCDTRDSLKSPYTIDSRTRGELIWY